MDTKEIFSKRLLELRESRKLSRQTAADSLQISRASLEYYEKGLRLPDVCILAKIADFYNVSSDYLLGRSDVKSIDADKQINAACRYTGLSEAALEEIKYLVEKNGEILKINYNIDLGNVNLLNVIFETETFQSLVYTVINYCGLYLYNHQKIHYLKKEYLFLRDDETMISKFFEEEYQEFLFNKQMLNLIKQLNTLLDNQLNTYIEKKEREENGEHNSPKE